MKTVLVTGGAGFIGSHIVRRLINEGRQVRVLDNFSTGFRKNLDDFPNIDLIEGDLRDPEAVKKAVEGVDLIFHEAALASVPRSIKDPLGAHEVNATGTLTLLHAALQAGISRVVYAGSSSAYGNAQAKLKSEILPNNPLSPYALTKLTGEGWCKLFARLYGLETVVIRYFNVFGPNQDPHSPYAAVIPRFISALIRNAQPTIYGDGEQSRAFTYVDNVVEMNMLAARVKGVSGEVINAGCGTQMTVNALAQHIAQAFGKKITPQYAQAQEGDVKHSMADISKAKRLLGYQPSVELQDGLMRTVKWYVEMEKAEARKCKPIKI